MSKHIINRVVLLVLTLVIFMQPVAIAQASSNVSRSGEFADTASIDSTCTEHWKGDWNLIDWANYSKAEWTSNSCNFEIQDRSICTGIYGQYTKYSGIVKGTNIWARASCEGGFYDALDQGAAHWRKDSKSAWSSWHVFYSF